VHVRHLCLFLYCLLTLLTASAESIPCPDKALICGVCKDVEAAVPNTIRNIEELGSRFADYRVIIYENNSCDNTVTLFRDWARANPKVCFLHEKVRKKGLPPSRTEKIARARNVVLQCARDPRYSDYKYLIMADLDFLDPWPIDEILETICSPHDWDCVSANGVRCADGIYYDRYAFRDSQYPLGPELLGDRFWPDLLENLFEITGNDWIPVFSAFGGLAIYKTTSVLRFCYSGTVTDDLRRCYEQILSTLEPSNPEFQRYQRLIGQLAAIDLEARGTDLPVIFQPNSPWEHWSDVDRLTCCEHVPLHASMQLAGFNKMYVNPKMVMLYRLEEGK
jgi:glycosyltransferase involved in cell wall biosynthesis